jgi:hypothetical protein
MSFSELLTTNITFDIAIILAIAVVILIVMVVLLNRKLNKFLIGLDSKNISDSLGSVSSDLSDLKSFRAELESYLSSVEKRLRKSVQAIHTIRFNPWHGTGEGGSQSFATAFMNEDGDGVVISSLYSRDHVSVFGKPLKKKSSPHELSTEEKQAVDEAAKELK